MKKAETSSFQDNIRRIFILYSIVPVFILTCLAVLLMGVVWSYTTIHSNQADNEQARGFLEEIISAHEQVLVEIGDPYDDSAIYEKLYRLKGELHLQGSFYILGEAQQELFSFGQELPGYLSRKEYRNWGILKRISEDRKNCQIAVQEGILCIGKALEYEGQEYELIFVIPASAWQSQLKTGNRTLIVTDDMGWIYYADQPGFRDELSRLQEQFLDQNGFLRVQGRQYFVVGTRLDGSGLRVITISDTEISQQIIVLVLLMILVIFLAIGIITLFSTKSMAAKYTRDIDEIALAFEKVEKGDLEVKLNTDSSKEFQAIGRDFNLMIDGLKDQIERNREMTQHVAFAQVKQLESQFNPHFIFNTLDNIRFMTKIDLKAADKMIVSLSRLLRYSIRDAREELTVEEDLDNLQSYLNILQIRFNKRFSYDINIDEHIMKCLIPKLLIQPLIENSVKYGFEGRDTLHVTVRGYAHGDKLIFICQDNGIGMSEELLMELRDQLGQNANTGTHMGLYNIHRRIHLLYKEDFGMKIESKPGDGTTITLSMPYRV